MRTMRRLALLAVLVGLAGCQQRPEPQTGQRTAGDELHYQTSDGEGGTLSRSVARLEQPRPPRPPGTTMYDGEGNQIRAGSSTRTQRPA